MDVFPTWAYVRQSCGYLIRNKFTAEDMVQINNLRESGFGKLDPNLVEAMKRRDRVSDHILAFHEFTGQLVGCYRLTSTLFSTDFDSSDSFDMSEVLTRPGVKLELSYACVDRKHRGGAVIRLMLAAVRDYCRYYNVETIFGSASLPTRDRSKALKIYNVLARREDAETDRDRMAPLLRFYYHLGASVLAPPIFDADYSCYDYLMALDLKEVSDSAWQRIMQL